ncbi:MAG: SPOR domain-containing protein [Treponemataceae bacterium]|nr:SPOR domain-containing protein [Treponemataceae bacterium]
MKKNFALILGFLCCGFIFTSFSPSIDGRAVVAEDGIMPKGIFAKTVGYLPGDSISVTNLAKKSTVDILVIGALDPSEGIAILLTPEAADLLGMDKKKNNVVKVTKRSGQLDETVSGTAVIGDVIDDDFDVEETERVEIAEVTENAEVIESVEVTENTEEEIEYEESPFVAVAEETEAEPEEEEDFEEDLYVPFESEESFEFEYVYEPSTEDTVEEEFEEIVEITAVENTEEPVFEKIEENDDFASEKSYVASEKVDEDDLLEYGFVPYENFDEDDVVAAVYEEIEPVFDEYVEEDYIEYIESEKSEVASKSFDEDAPPQYVRVEDDVDDFDESVSSVLFEEVEEDEEIAYSPEPVSDVYVVENESPDEECEIEENIESYDAIVLVPANPKTPEEPVEYDAEELVPLNETSVTFEAVSDEAEVALGEEGIVLVPLVDEEMRAESAIEESGVTQIVEDFAFDAYMVSDLKFLESGKYYVQIAIYNDNVNIRGVLDKYSENYPMVIVPTASGKANQVMVGPLNIDEYGTVLNRFKSYGYKDAFLRKIR